MVGTVGWQAPVVTLVDGTEVLSDSEEWRAQCEAMEMLRRMAAGHALPLDVIEKRRGREAAQRLWGLMLRIEPWFVLDRLTDRIARREYMLMVQSERGQSERDALYDRCMAIHAERQAVVTA